MAWRNILKAHSWVLAVIRGCSVIAFAIGTAAISGHITHRIHWYKWDADTPMPLNVAIAVDVLSAAVYILSLYVDRLVEKSDIK